MCFNFYTLAKTFYLLCIMVIKILKSTGNSFSAVNYNETKNDKGKGELLHTENFEAIDGANATKEDYKSYLRLIAEQNKHVKNPQFHAVISCKGQERTFDELKNIGIDFMKYMGYGNSPYLIYAHNDNANNHIHIVGSRVDLDGKKVNQTFERIRSQSFLKVRGLSISIEPSDAVKLASSYSFTSKGQILALLQQNGFNVRFKEDNLEIISGGKATKISSSIYQSWIGESNTKRLAQLREIFKKYSTGDFEGLKHTLKSKFGIELIPHLTKEDKKLFGYTVIDHSSKQVFKGSDILPLKALQAKTDISDQLKQIIANSATFSQLKTNIRELGLSVNAKGDILLGNVHVAKVSESKMKELNAAEKLQLASSIKLDTVDSLNAFKKVLNIPSNFDDAIIDPLKGEMLKSKLAGLIGSNRGGELNQLGIYFYQDKSNLYALDFKNKVFTQITGELKHAVSAEGIKIRDIGPKELLSNTQFKLNQSGSSWNNAASIISGIANQKFGEKERDKRRKQQHNL